MFITGGKQFSLQNSGGGTCAVAINQNTFVTIGGAHVHGKVDRCLMRTFLYALVFFRIFPLPNLHFPVKFPNFGYACWPRYDSEGKYLDSFAELGTPRDNHACSSFTSSEGEEVCDCCIFV